MKNLSITYEQAEHILNSLIEQYLKIEKGLEESDPSDDEIHREYYHGMSEVVELADKVKTLYPDLPDVKWLINEKRAIKQMVNKINT